MYSECPLHWKLNYVDKLKISESNIHLIFGSAMHEVLQTYLNIMYMDSVKNADILDLNKLLRDKLSVHFFTSVSKSECSPIIVASLNNKSKCARASVLCA